jgi:hypothetical protein
MDPLQRSIRTAAVHDRKVARAVYRFAMRVTPVSGLLNARVIVRALLIDRRVRRAAARAVAREVEQAVVRSRSA